MHRTQLRGVSKGGTYPLWSFQVGRSTVHTPSDPIEGWMDGGMERKEGIRSHRTKERNEEGQATLVIPCVGRGHADAPSEIRR